PESGRFAFLRGGWFVPGHPPLNPPDASFPDVCNGGSVCPGCRAERVWPSPAASVAELRSQQELRSAARTCLRQTNGLSYLDLLPQSWGRWPPKFLLRSFYCSCHMLRSRENPSSSSWHVKRQTTPSQIRSWFSITCGKSRFLSHTHVAQFLRASPSKVASVRKP